MRSVRGAAVLVVVAVLAAIGFVVFAKDDDKGGSAKDRPSAGPSKGKDGTDPSKRPVTLIGDGSTADTGPQPDPFGYGKPEKLKPGEKPPQFVVFSWDGAGEQVNKRLFERFRKAGRENKANMTFFLTGLYVLPEGKLGLYNPPQHKQGAQDVGMLTDENVKLTIEQIPPAWMEGNEIGTHFNGHFCGPKGGGDWSPEEWKSELEQSIKFVETWKTNNPTLKDLPPFPFDYKKELIGSRAPCLEGQKNLITASKEFGWRYDTSGNGTQVWPKQKEGIWDMSLQSMPFPGRAFETLSMDYNLMANTPGGADGKGDPSKYPAWEKQATDMFIGGFERAYNGNRAPVVIGNHFESWNGGIYMNAVENTMKAVCKKDGVRCVSFRQVVDWMDAQDPAVIAKLQGLPIGKAPDWSGVVPAAFQEPPAGTAPAGAANAAVPAGLEPARRN